MLILQASTGITIDSQIIGSFIQVFFGALIMLMAAGMGWAFTVLSHHGERLARVEMAQEFYMNSNAENHRHTAAGANPVTEEEAAYLDYVLARSDASYHELKGAAEIAYREVSDPSIPKEKREPYVNVLPVLDTRMALRAFDDARKQLPPWRRFLAGLGFG